MDQPKYVLICASFKQKIMFQKGTNIWYMFHKERIQNK